MTYKNAFDKVVEEIELLIEDYNEVDKEHEDEQSKLANGFFFYDSIVALLKQMKMWDLSAEESDIVGIMDKAQIRADFLTGKEN